MRAITVGLTYAAIRVLLVAGLDPVTTPDSLGYHDVSLIGRAERLWMYPAVRWMVPDPTLVYVQAIISAVAFMALAVAIGSTIRDHRVRTAVMAVVLVLGLTPRITSWDALMLTESLAVSTTCLLIAAWIFRHTIPAVALVAIAVAWLFVRESHPYLATVALVPLGVAAWRDRRRGLSIALCVVVVWALAAVNVNREVEAYNVTANISHRVTHDTDHFRWFIDQGMPVSDVFLFGLDRFTMQVELGKDEEFVEWAGSDGPRTYAEFLATHPSFTVEGVTALVADDSYVVDESMLDETFAVYSAPRGQFLRVAWPSEASLFSLLLALGAVVAILVGQRAQGLREERWLTPTVLLASTIPHGLLVYHAAPVEIARHAVVLAVVFVVSCVWLVSLAADALVVERRVAPRGERRLEALLPHVPS